MPFEFKNEGSLLKAETPLLSIEYLHRQYQNQVITPTEITQALLNRIEKTQPLLNAFITVTKESALEEAAQSTRRYQEGRDFGPLDGIPYGVKDIIDTKDIPTSMGCSYYKDFCPSEDATVVQKLRQAGAILLGKHNTQQFAMGATGDGSFAGPVHNPFCLDRIAGGSSSGSAAAVAAGLNVFSIGTDTGGSIRVPATFCGVIGVKPTYGCVSMRGIFPASISFDTIGILTHTVSDSATVLSILAGFDPDADISNETPDIGYTEDIGKSIKGQTISVPKNFFSGQIDTEIEAAFWENISLLEKSGADIQEVIFPDIQNYRPIRTEILMAEAYAVHRDLFKKHPEVYEPEVAADLDTGKRVPTWKYIQDLQKTREFRRVFRKYMDQVSLLAVPSTAITATKIYDHGPVKVGQTQTGLYEALSRFNWFGSMSGCPAIVLPSGIHSSRIPMAIQLIGRPNREIELYQVASTLERMRKENI